MSNNFFLNLRLKNQLKANDTIFKTSSYNSTKTMITLDLILENGC